MSGRDLQMDARWEWEERGRVNSIRGSAAIWDHPHMTFALGGGFPKTDEISDKLCECEGRGRGKKYPKIVWTSYVDGPLWQVGRPEKSPSRSVRPSDSILAPFQECVSALTLDGQNNRAVQTEEEVQKKSFMIS